VSEKLLSSEEASQYLGIHPYTLSRWAKAKKIPGFRVGKFWRFKKERLDAWLEKRANIKNS